MTTDTFMSSFHKHTRAIDDSCDDQNHNVVVTQFFALPAIPHTCRSSRLRWLNGRSQNRLQQARDRRQHATVQKTTCRRAEPSMLKTMMVWLHVKPQVSLANRIRTAESIAAFHRTQTHTGF